MVCTNPNCGKDCPYADSPNPRTFRCYECTLISEMMGNKPEAKTVQLVARPVKRGDKVRRHAAGIDPVIYEVGSVDNYFFFLVGTNLGPSYSQHCVKGKFPYWEHEDGSPIIPPTP